MRIGILTGGGDAPGLNAAIRAVVLRATSRGHTVLGIHDGWAGLLGDPSLLELSATDVEDIHLLGGTILGTSRTDPRQDAATRRQVLENVRRLGLDALVAVGGNDTLGVAEWLHREGVRVVGVPKTIDNDLAATDYCIGFDTAVSVVAEALDRLRTTASAHHRAMVVEVMGRDTGWVAAIGGITGGADLVLVPEIPTTADEVVAAVRARQAMGSRDSIIVVAEAIEIAGLPAAAAVERDAFGHPRLDQRGIGAALARHIQGATGVETRVVVLGHLQRGGSPTTVDRLWATRFGDAAVDLIEEGRFGTLPVARGNGIAIATLAEAVRETRAVPPDLLRLVTRFGGVGERRAAARIAE